MPRILVIDSYDSFVYNLVQYLGELGADPVVYRNDAISVDEALALEPDGVLLSPGPGRPETSGIICEAIPAFAAVDVPLLGVCLGHQAIGHGAVSGVVGSLRLRRRRRQLAQRSRGVGSSGSSPRRRALVSLSRSKSARRM